MHPSGPLCRVCVCVCVRERESVCVCVLDVCWLSMLRVCEKMSVFMRERERERERVCVSASEREYKNE